MEDEVSNQFEPNQDMLQSLMKLGISKEVGEQVNKHTHTKFVIIRFLF